MLQQEPSVLNGGLGPALKTLAGRPTIAVQLRLGIDRWSPEPGEVGAYYVVTEAVMNPPK